ncbi:putative ABC exporter [Mobilisporobacter senegalensis]|uniref:Putative ABC exporter n=1 Tax=Mobilisporobacter senegalensis TaxID=1329262 RepID=A0A3N1XX09_9FIRM|nr:putative ABC exporter domain-containing protein [Mobilisporobacter senegalensis]ROR30828.1 putative ABC exporter [Mobilisporobacter senegalensis]
MRGLIYLLLTIMKNRLLSLKKKPAILVIYILCALSIIGMLIASTFMPADTTTLPNLADIRILYGVVAGIGLIFGYTFVNTGLSTGGTLFTMSDVSLLFVSPVSPIRILIYGLIKQLGTTFLTSIFILFQYVNLKKSFNISGTGMLFIFFIYGIMIFFGQLLSIAVYVYTNGNSKKKTIIRSIVYLIFIGIAFFVYQNYRLNGDILESLLDTADSKLFQMVPLAGWAAMFIKAYIEKDLLFLIIGLGLFILASILIILMITAGEADYYEDVLLSTEINYNKLQAAKEGKITKTKKKIKLRKNELGIQKGNGANVLFYKHLLEAKRSSRLIFVDSYTIMVTLGAGALSYFVNTDFVGYIILGTLVYILFFFTIMGKLTIELTKPFIYMIPDKSIKKLLAASLTNIIKPYIDGLIIFGVVGLITGTSPLLNIFFALAYGSSAMLFISFTILSQRFLGGQLNKVVLFMFGMGLLMLIISPGIIASIVAVSLLPESFLFLGTLPYTLWCLFISGVAFLICGNLLDQTELSDKPI